MEFDRLSDKYRGQTAANYDANRRNAKWDREQQAVAEMLSSLPPDATILDIPVGTGRFVPLYEERAGESIGMDISDDMLSEARTKTKPEESKVSLRIGDISNIDMPAQSVDCVVCIRFLNWIDFNAVENVVGELHRVSRSFLLVGIRHYVPLGRLLASGKLNKAFRQIWWKSFKRKNLVVHQHTPIQSLFERLDLKVHTKMCVDAPKNGTEYYIYLLRK